METEREDERVHVSDWIRATFEMLFQRFRRLALPQKLMLCTGVATLWMFTRPALHANREEFIRYISPEQAARFGNGEFVHFTYLTFGPASIWLAFFLVILTIVLALKRYLRLTWVTVIPAIIFHLYGMGLVIERATPVGVISAPNMPSFYVGSLFKANEGNLVLIMLLLIAQLLISLSALVPKIRVQLQRFKDPAA